MDNIIAGIISGITVIAGIALIIMTWGAATPLTSLGTALLLSVGAKGLENVIGQTLKGGNFSWSNWASD